MIAMAFYCVGVYIIGCIILGTAAAMIQLIAEAFKK